MWYEPKEKTLHSGSGATGNGQIFDLEGKYGALRLQVTGITSATITFEQCNDGGTTWDGIAGINTETGAKVTTTIADGTFLFPIPGVKKFRARISTYVTGTIYAYATAVPAVVAPMEVYASLLAGTQIAGKVGIDQTTPGTTNGVQVNAALPAGTNIVGKVGIDQTTDGTTNKVHAHSSAADDFLANANLQLADTDVSSTNPVPTQERPTRAAGVLHRDGITAVDKVADIANTDITSADNGAGTGSLNASTTYYTTVIPGNKYGPCKVAGTINTQATAASGLNTHSIRLTFSAKTNAEWYDIFLSTDAAPKWVARVTEAQRAAGDYEVTAVGTVAAGGGNPADTVDVNVAGTGIQTSNIVFTQSNAYTPAAAGITAIDCSNRTKAYVHVALALTDLRSAPSLRIIPFLRNALDTSIWHQGSAQVVSVLTTLGLSLYQVFEIDINDADQLKILVDTILGQGAAVSIWIQLV